MIYLAAALYSLVIWWTSTGAVIVLYRLPRRTYPLSFTALTLVAAGCIWGTWATRGDTSLPGAYAAFSCGTLLWGWQLAGFFYGYITGPHHAPGSAPPRGVGRFIAAVRSSLYHELLAVGGGALLLAIVWGHPNQTSFHVYVLLWALHAAAKLNIFAGARNFNIELLPDHLRFLGEFFRERRMNTIFPATATATIALAALLAEAALRPAATPYAAATLTLMALMALLGLLEIWLLMLPAAGETWGER